jgi:predicted RNA-binding protein with PIN domain
VLPLLRQLEEEDPLLRVTWQSHLQQIQVQLMGEVQLEVLQQQILDRFGLEVTFDEGSILYRETISSPVEGVGHYEPLRHYAEVHLYMEPLPAGSGIVLSSACDSAVLDFSWQHQVLCALEEKTHVGVLGGFPITDMRITLVSGRAHLKHTEGGDFRQAAWRALRQGLMRAAERGDAVLLEPIESIELELPRVNVGRAMTDLQNMGAKFEMQETEGDADRVLLIGRAPASALRGYAKEVIAYTRGEGKLSSVYDGYAPCHNTDDVLRLMRYEPTRDMDNPCDSVFCSHGAGFSVPWNEVEQHMHLPPYYVRRVEDEADAPERAARVAKGSVFTEDRELEALMEREFGPIRRKSYGEKRVVAAPTHVPTVVNTKLRRLVLDGYNVIFGWDALREVGEQSIDAARALLIDAMCNYAGYTDIPVDIVFDAYRVKGGVGEEEQRGRVHIVYTKEFETADAYIERLLTRESRDYSIRVVTSDRLIQVTAVSTGVLRMPVAEFVEELGRVREEIAQIAELKGK